MQTQGNCNKYEEESEELKDSDQKSILYISPARVEQHTFNSEISKSSLKQLFIFQLDQQRGEVFHHVFHDPISDFLESMNSMNVKIFLIDESWSYHLFKTHLYLLWLSSSIGSRSKMSVNQFLTWLHWKHEFT